LKFSLHVRHIGFQNDRHLKAIFAIISRSNAAIDLKFWLLYTCAKTGACITKCTFLEYLGNTVAVRQHGVVFEARYMLVLKIRVHEQCHVNTFRIGTSTCMLWNHCHVQSLSQSQRALH